MKSEKNAFWASDYWSHVVLQEVKNHNNTGGSYGSKGDDNWQVIALAEGWAYYREWDLARRYLSWNTLTKRDLSESTETPDSYYSIRPNNFPGTFTRMFYRLSLIGCSFSNMEKSLCSYSVTGFRDNLIAKHPNLRTQITNIVNEYQ
jgi:hypothetical protein